MERPPFSKPIQGNRTECSDANHAEHRQGGDEILAQLG
jgi:hypothetical protein